jgi:hypothetical protein
MDKSNDKYNKTEQKDIDKEPEKAKNDEVQDSNLSEEQAKQLQDAEDEQEQLVDSITEQHAEEELEEEVIQEVQPANGLLLKISLGLSGATLLVVLGMAMFGGSSTAKQDTLNRVGNMLKKHHETVMETEQNLLDDLGKLNTKVVSLQAGQLKLSKNMSQLGENQQKVIDSISELEAPDLSSINASLELIKSGMNQPVGVTQSHHAHVSDKEQILKSKPESNKNIELSYVAISPNGALLTVTQAGETTYLTVNPRDNTPYGKVSYVSNDEIKIGSHTIKYGSDQPTTVRIGGHE